MPLPRPLSRALRATPSRPLSPQTSFFLVREDTKAAVLLHLLRSVVRPQDQTVVFVATKHHAEYLSEVRGPGWLRKAAPGHRHRHLLSLGLQFRVHTPEGSTRAGHGRPGLISELPDTQLPTHGQSRLICYYSRHQVMLKCSPSRAITFV